MNKWVKISDYLFFQEGPGVRNNQYTSEGVKLLNVANLVNGEVDLSTSNRYILVEEAYGKYKHFLADEGDLIIASSGIKVEYFDKKMGFIKKEHLPICMNTSTIRFKSLDINKLNINYFMYYLKSQSFKSQLSKQITGSAQLNFGPSHLKKMKFPIVSLNEQLLINSILGNLDNQIRLKEKQIIEYDSLIKSRFVELFLNKNYGYKSLKDLLKSKAEYGAASASVPYENGRPRYVRITDINDDGTLNNDTVCSINTQDDIDYKLEYGDFLFARMGATVGKTYAFIEGNEIFAGYLIRYKLDLNKINPRYLFAYTKTNEYNMWVKNNQSGAAQPGINAKKYDLLPVPVPPIELQNEFASFVKQVDKLKFAIQASLEETRKLFDSLMQKYFG